MLILYAEDEDNDAFFLKHAFKLAGSPHTLRRVSDGEQAISYLAGAEPFAETQNDPLPGLVLLDINMPKRTGLEVLAWIRGQDRFKSVPVIILTSSLLSEEMQHARELGADDCFSKPSDPLKLVEFVNLLHQRWGLPSAAREGDPRSK